MSDKRSLVFISHANPEDNAFTLWLASRLTAAGYLVWSDVTKLFGAELFWEDIEDAIRNHASKVIVVLSNTAQQKAGVLDEIAVAVSVERTQNIERFVVPIRIDDLPYSDVKPNLTRKNIIDFHKKWAEGFYKLVKVLERDNVPAIEKRNLRETSHWIEQLVAGSETVVTVPETIFSNWFSFSSLPATLNFFKVPGSADQLRNRFAAFDYPAYPYRDMIATFASIDDVDRHLPAWQAAMTAHKIPLTNILNGEPNNLYGLEWSDSSRMLSYLLRTAWDNAMKLKDLRPYEMSSGKMAWYPVTGYAPSDKAHFADIDGVLRWRKLIGKSEKRQVHWHFGVEALPSIGKEPFLTLKPHVVFSEDGKVPISSDKRMHRMRRGFCKSWWNARWRDLILAYTSWLSGGNSFIELPVGSDQSIKLCCRPITFESPVSLVGLTTASEIEADVEAETDENVDDIYWVMDDDIDEDDLDESEVEILEGKKP